jgi:DNA-binding phage protein
VARTSDWNEQLAKRLKNTGYARDFVIACLDEGLPIQVALGKVVRAYGVKEFAKKIHMAPSNLVRALNPDTKSLTTKTLNQILKPLGLELSLKRSSGAA